MAPNSWWSHHRNAHNINDQQAVEFIDEELEDNERDNETDDDHIVNFSAEVDAALDSIPSMAQYIGCINCAYPLAYPHEIMEILYSRVHTHNMIGSVFPLSEETFARMRIGEISQIHWQTRVYCPHCNIMLSILELNNFNCAIDEYCSDEACIILDAATFALYTNVR